MGNKGEAFQKFCEEKYKDWNYVKAGCDIGFMICVGVEDRYMYF